MANWPVFSYLRQAVFHGKRPFLYLQEDLSWRGDKSLATGLSRSNRLYQADLAMINPFSLAASRRIATNFEVGVWLPSPVLSSGTNGFTSG